MKIGILTGGGDCPGLNAVIRAAVKGSLRRGWDVYGIRKGFEGLLDTSAVTKLTGGDVTGILNRGGTILGTSNRSNPFKVAEKVNGEEIVRDRSDDVVANFKKLGLEALVVIGGDGTLGIAAALGRKGIPVVGVPKTIDNDLSSTVITFGFDTAVSVATDAIDRLHSTAQSHERVMVVELMGRYAGWIALNAGVAGGADIILIPEIPFRMESVCRKVEERYESGSNFCIVVVAEGATPAEGGVVVKKDQGKGRAELLGGIADRVAHEITEMTGRESRALVLGHLQRGGEPTTFDRLVATRFGAAAVRMVAQEKFQVMVALHPPDIVPVPIEEAIGQMKTVPTGSDVITSARELGISFGD
ncbi:MAG: ATP-dependent 6-phosphofructokinase [Candidatus Hydrogenedentota bacterium]